MSLRIFRSISLVTLILVSASLVLAQGRLHSRFGQAQVGGRTVTVHVTVGVPEGVDGNQAAAEALRAQGARPISSQEFATTGLVWSQFLDGVPGNDFMTQHYNPAGDPTASSQGRTILGSTHTTWGVVTPSIFQFDLDPVDTNRCPSLVRECPGKQVFDDNNDVGWVALNGPFTLAVTWFGGQEADVAMNANFTWNTDGTDFDAETVLLHEEGHALGLDHSQVVDAVMFASYSVVRQDLHDDDIAGINSLYTVCTPDEGLETLCADGNDNDCNGFADEADFNCQFLACGDGTVDVFEECDLSSADPLTESCGSLGFDSGDLSCTSDCTFDTSACVAAICELLPKGDFCTVDSECCSNKCKGKPGAKTCK